MYTHVYTNIHDVYLCIGGNKRGNLALVTSCTYIKYIYIYIYAHIHTNIHT